MPYPVHEAVFGFTRVCVVLVLQSAQYFFTRSAEYSVLWNIKSCATGSCAHLLSDVRFYPRIILLLLEVLVIFSSRGFQATLQLHAWPFGSHAKRLPKSAITAAQMSRKHIQSTSMRPPQGKRFPPPDLPGNCMQQPNQCIAAKTFSSSANRQLLDVGLLTTAYKERPVSRLDFT